MIEVYAGQMKLGPVGRSMSMKVQDLSGFFKEKAKR